MIAPVARTLALALVAAVALTGCPSSAHRIPQHDLAALAQTPPEQRGEHVRVIQSLGSHDDPPPAPRAGGVAVYVAAPIWIDGTPRYHRNRPGGAPHAHGGRGGYGLGAAKKDQGKAYLVLAAIAAVALAATEGARYDGWVRMHPMQPVHLFGHHGEYTWMPLAHITPDVAAWTDHAVVRDDEGPWEPLGRAPLNRVGFTYSLLLGSGQIALEGADPITGFTSHIQFGYFPAQQVGLQFDIGYGWADDELGNTIFDGRAGLELDVLPLDVGILHGGVFGQLGISSRSDDGLDTNDSNGVFGGGALAQIELTTRLAITLRAGMVRAYGENLAEFTGGVSVY
jgi:hypothetical protein